MLSLYRALIACRRSTPALLQGAYLPVEVNTQQVYAFLRKLPPEPLGQPVAQRGLVALNFSDQLISLSLPQLGKGKVQLSTFLNRDEPVNLASLEVGPNEGVIVELEPKELEKDES